MTGYFRKLEDIVLRYKHKYAKHPKKAALRLVWWNLVAFVLSREVKKSANAVEGAWVKILNEGVDITGNYAQEIKNFKIPKDVYINSFNIDAALSSGKNFKRMGLVFFMGIGDYFLATNFIEVLKKRYPHIAFDAYVSKNIDGNNSPLVAECLKVNPNFENIYYFDGRPTRKNYDFSDCYKKIKEDTLLLPVVYGFGQHIKSRHETLCQTFGLSKPNFTPIPKVYTDYPVTPQVSGIIVGIDKKMQSKKGIIWLQLAARSSNYIYNHDKAVELIEGFANEGYLVINLDLNLAEADHIINLDIKKVTINESIKLLAELNKKYKVYCAGINSCFVAISSGLKIQNLLLQNNYDKCIESVWFPNVFVIGNAEYAMLPKSRVFEASLDDYTLNAGKRFDYNPEFVLECFKKFQEQV
ncbi:MAG: hypothetical protein FWC85_01110 [Elusimicrobia bacterium]|nr:hypothetical protein [Elusimicrobiota bacterium]